ncbi:hypothetical protein CYMTET_30314 [Cymbomonas tetramitiformis]|uniref:HMA domain-containing protein n=1 Tax=Cymbomonas tetramitiformis TaxID=36881 RepID=A0AAE0FJ79_9CHLO|nr:hypothetical protein CYMTET_30314 [Cymbomonas tetramitiformis]
MGKDVKSAHLIFSPGFPLQFAKILAALSVLAAVARQSEAVRFEAEYLYDWFSFQLMQGAHHMAWWTAIGLLSSSCCALQLILNFFSLGCAGFNTVLGPVRPFLMASTLLLQVWTWSVAYARPYQWKAAAVSSSVCLVLTFLPECLYFASRGKKVIGRVSTSGFKVQFSLGTAMGCVACVTKVKGVLDACSAVTQSSVSLEEGMATICLSAPTASEASGSAEVLAQQLEAAGFPATIESLMTMPSALTAEDLASDTSGTCVSKQGDSTSAAGDSRRGMWKWALSAAAGLLSSSCCLLQLFVNLLSMLNLAHVGCAGFNKVLGPHRFELRCVTAAWLSAFWASSIIKRWPKKQLFLSTLLTLCLTFLPEVLKYVGAPALAPPTDDTEHFVFSIDGMGCEACQLHVENLLHQTSGVIQSSADFERGVVEVLVAKDWGFNITDVANSLAYDGYELSTVLRHSSSTSNHFQAVENLATRGTSVHSDDL